MVEFLSPAVTIRELPSIAGVSTIESTSIPIFHNTATRGPINRPITVTSLADYESVYGPDDGGYGYQSAVGFFGNDGRRLVVNRVAAYTDITDPSTLTASASETTLNTPNPVATAATKSSNAGPWNLRPGVLGATSPYELTVPIDGAPASTYTWVPTPGSVQAAGVPGGVGSAGDTLTFTVTTPDGGAQQFTTPPLAAPLPTSAGEWAAFLTASIPGAYFTVAGGGEVQGNTEGMGTGFNIQYDSATGSAGADSGFGGSLIAGTPGGPAGVADVSKATAAELAPLIQAAWSGGGGTAVTANLDGSLTVATVATGAAASLGDVVGSLASVFGFAPAGVVAGSGAGGAGVPTLKFIASSEGAHGNSLAVTTQRQNRILGNLAANLTGGGPFNSAELTAVDGLRPGIQLFLEDTVTGAVLRAVIAKITGNTAVFAAPATAVGGDLLVANNPTASKETFDVTFIIDGESGTVYRDLSMSPLDVRFFIGNVIGTDVQAIDPRQRMVVELQGAPISATEDPRPTDVTVQVLAGGVDSNPLTDNDYVGSAASGLGIPASDRSNSFSMMAIPGIETVPVQRAQMDYANSRKRHVAILNAPPGLTDAQVVDWFTVQAAIFGTYTIAYAGELNIIRSSSGAQEVFPTAGYLCGVYARNDVTRNVATPPAGTRNGLIAGAIGVANDNYYASKPRRDTLYPNPGVNTVWLKDGRGIVAWGQLTMDPSSDRGAIGIRRALISIERDLERLSDFVLFELNNTVLREQFKTVAGGYLRQRWRDGVLQGDNVRQAYEIICDATNNPPSVVNALQFFADVKVNLIPGVDYVVINIQRDDRSLQEELASAA